MQPSWGCMGWQVRGVSTGVLNNVVSDIVLFSSFLPSLGAKVLCFSDMDNKEPVNFGRGAVLLLFSPSPQVVLVLGVTLYS